MPDTRKPPPSCSEKSARARRGASITPILPLFLLEAMRDMDRPEEVLEEEDVSVSMPRRFGLSDVVGAQIRRFREEVEEGRPQNAATVEDLIRLVARRPDAERIFLKAGRRVAWNGWEERSSLAQRLLPRAPRRLALAAARRAVRRTLKSIAGPGRFSLKRWPLETRIVGTMSAAADPTGGACVLYSGVLAELLHQYTGQPYRVDHPRCEAHGGEVCAWVAEPREGNRE